MSGTTTDTATTSRFARPSEAEAYLLLHSDGFNAFHDHYGTGVAYDLLNGWADRGMLRISHPDGALTVRTFKKYAKKAEQCR